MDRSVGGELQSEFEHSSVCLDKMVQHFIEENNDNNYYQCNCVDGNCFCSTDGGSDDEFDSFNCFGNSFNCSSLKVIIMIIQHVIEDLIVLYVRQL